MHLDDLNCSTEEAFVRGFWRGLGASTMIFSTYALPKEAEPVLARIENPAEKSDGVQGDWVRVGDLLRSAAKAVNTANG